MTVIAELYHMEFRVDLNYHTDFTIEDGYYWVIRSYQKSPRPWYRELDDHYCRLLPYGIQSRFEVLY
jgi:hypothetical protein